MLIVQGERDQFGDAAGRATAGRWEVAGNHALKSDLPAVGAAVTAWLAECSAEHRPAPGGPGWAYAGDVRARTSPAGSRARGADARRRRAPAAAAEPTKRALTFDVIVGPNDDTPCTITADLYTPAGASRSRPVPAILGTNGFGGSKSDFDDARARLRAARLRVPRLLGPRASATAAARSRSTTPTGTARRAASSSPSSAARRPRRTGRRSTSSSKDGPGDPRVGMIGGSYGGQIQFAIAGHRPRGSTRSSRRSPGTTSSYSLGAEQHRLQVAASPTARRASTKIDWPVLFSALGLAPGLPAGRAEPGPEPPRRVPELPRPGLPRRWSRRSITGYPDDGDARAAAPRVGRARTCRGSGSRRSSSRARATPCSTSRRRSPPTSALRAQGTPVKMLWRSSGHSGGGIDGRERQHRPREGLREPAGARSGSTTTCAASQPKPALDFSFLRDWVELQGRRRAGRRRHADATRPGRPTRSSSRARTSSARRKSRVAAGSASFAAIPGASGSGGGGHRRSAGARRPGHVRRPTPARRSPRTTDVVGVPQADGPPRRADVRADARAPTRPASSSCSRSCSTSTPDGGTTLPRNQLSAVRVADVTKPVEIELPGIVHRFAKGHRFRARGDHQQLHEQGQHARRARCRSPPTPPTPARSRCRGSASSVSTLPGRCLSRRSPIGPRNIGRIRLGYTRAQILRRVRVQPERRTRPHLPLLRDRPHRAS